MDLIKLTLDTRYIINIIENVLKWLVKEPVGVELAFLHNKTVFVRFLLGSTLMLLLSNANVKQ